MKKRATGKKAYLTLLAASIIIMAGCDRQPVEPPVPQIPNLKIRQLRELYQGTDVVVDTNAYIQGIITLTPELNNIPDFIAYIQDSTAGITLTITGTNSLSMGSEVKIPVRGITLTEYRGLMQFGDIDLATGSELVALDADPLQPRQVTLSDVLNGKHVAELVEINDVQFVDAGTFNGTRMLTDCLLEAEVYTRSAATFSASALPAGNGRFTGVISVYDTPQLIVRDPSELAMEATRCEPPQSEWLNEDFEALSVNDTVSDITGWLVALEKGTRYWVAKTVNGSRCAQVTAASSNQAEVVAWLITPACDITAAVNPVLTFSSSVGFDNGATLEVFVLNGYNPQVAPWDYTWTKLNPVLAVDPGTGFSNWTSSGEVNLSAYKGLVSIAFKYTGGDKTGTLQDDTSTWQIDNVRIAESGTK